MKTEYKKFALIEELPWLKQPRIMETFDSLEEALESLAEFRNKFCPDSQISVAEINTHTYIDKPLSLDQLNKRTIIDKGYFYP